MLNLKKFLLATISYVVLTMLIAYPWHMIWFHDLYGEMGAYTRPIPSVPLGMFSMVIQGVVIAYLYPIFYRTGHPIVQGIKFNMLIGAVIYSVMGLAMAAKIDINPISTYLVYNLGFQLIQVLLTGTALGVIYGKIDSLNTR
ncbi:hypothetical protein [Paraglaciecola sp.]|uniref:hypothetical protein n=1 Tax=Paraglaciecola sp. TaxID=1920173 RepID=UPI003EF833CD